MKLLRDNWFLQDIPASINLEKPGIYEWRIGGAEPCVSVGQSKRLKGRAREYVNNIRKMVNGLPYRKGKPTKFRAVHHGLRKGHDNGLPITFTVLENCDEAFLNEREQFWINRRVDEERAGGPRVLNGPRRS